MQTIHITTLGCDKNTIDSQLMAGLLDQKTQILVDDPKEAEVIIVNTCCFIDEAKEESIDYILDYVKLKETGKCQMLIIAGCMAQRYHEELKEEIPEIDAFVGVGQFDHILDAIKDGQAKYVDEIERDYAKGLKRLIKKGCKTAYVRISEGCDHACTYCAIPAIRGTYRSRQQEEILNELSYLQSKGIIEIILIGQDIAPYGEDLEGDKSLPKLLQEIVQTFDFKWIRMLYLYPEGITSELLEVVKRHPTICQYFDIPLQHTETTILKKMGRKMTSEKIAEILSKIRNFLPDAVLRTTLITGFPGESLMDHQALLKQIDHYNFDHLGVFRYSQEEKTKAADFSGQIEEAEKLRRYDQIMITQQGISRRNKERFLAKVLDVLIEEQEGSTYYGRFYGDAPEIDGSVIVESPDQALELGEMVAVKIIKALEYDLIGDVRDELTQ